MKKKIVIIEDELILQELHKHYVTNMGHEVLACFETGKDAIAFFEENHADLILMDIRLEGDLDGIETAGKISELRSIPLVYVSANTDDSTYNRALSTNMSGYLSKPLSANELEEIIENITSLTESILYAQRIQKQLFAKEEELVKFFKQIIYINRPRDIVTGDFCFIGGKNLNKEIIIGVGDCTGHGVPGALLSIVCYNLLKNITLETNNLALILDEFYFRLKLLLMPISSDIVLNDSMDMIIFKLKKWKTEIEIYGNKREFIYYNSKNQEHINIRVRINELGALEESSVKIKFSKDDIFYFYSDGITDQFGGDFDKKLTRKRLISFLESDKLNTNMSLKQMRLNIFLRKWQGKTNQTDDMIFFAIQPSLYCN